MTEFQTRCPCSICRKVRAKQQPAGHTGVDYPTPLPWQIGDGGYIIPNTQLLAQTWALWETETPIFHDAVIAHNIWNQDRRMEELK